MEIETILRYSLKTNESMISLMWNLKTNDTNEFICKQKQTHRFLKQRGKRFGKMEKVLNAGDGCTAM